jgi:hypothetical protein
MYHKDLESNHIVYEAAKDKAGKPITIAVDGAERKARYNATMKSLSTRRLTGLRDRDAGDRAAASSRFLKAQMDAMSAAEQRRKSKAAVLATA